MTALDLAVVSWRVWLNELVMNPQFSQRLLKGGLLPGALRVETIGELKAIICLDALYGVRKALCAMLNKFRR